MQAQNVETKAEACTTREEKRTSFGSFILEVVTAFVVVGVDWELEIDFADDGERVLVEDAALFLPTPVTVTVAGYLPLQYEPA